jgi:ribosomal protein L29
MAKQLKNMTVEELETHLQGLDEQKQDIRRQQLEAHAELDRLNAEADAERKLANMSEPERAAILQALKAEGVESTESVQS